jgi:hypothetical protein
MKKKIFFFFGSRKWKAWKAEGQGDLVLFGTTPRFFRWFLL